MLFRRPLSSRLCLTLLLAASARAASPYLEQGGLWNDLSIRERYWFTDQGSKLMPYAWFTRLKRADGSAPFSQGMERYGFIPFDFDPPSPLVKRLNPDNLPVGFAIHEEGGKRWVGLTCAACHTGRIDHGGHSLIVEGAPGMLNFDLFFGELVDALNAPVNTADSLGANPAELTQLRNKLTARKAMNASPVPAGFARVDAFSQIFNQLAISALGNDPAAAGVPNAPASYPFLWDIAQHEFLQWNGSAPNLGVGGTGSKLRNLGEVLGVFGEVTIPNPDQGMKYKSSANLPNLLQIEDWIAKLLPPAWPADFPKPPPDSVEAGKALYETQCIACHQILKRGELKYPVPIHMTPVDEVQTDRQLVDNFRVRTAKTNQLEGTAIRVDVKHPFQKFGAVAPMSTLGAHVTIGALAYLENPGLLEKAKDALKSLEDGTSDASSYKARPLDGIWATAPYLHNGSVPSLEELLKAPKDRVPEFCVGSFDYDPVTVGYSTACSAHTSKFDTTRLGNSNAGHDYGVRLNAKQKTQLLDYLKTL